MSNNHQLHRNDLMNMHERGAISAPLLQEPNPNVPNEWKREAHKRQLNPESLLLEMFDPAWYLRTNADVAEAEVDPIKHFFECGLQEGRNCCPYFDAAWYLQKYPDVAADGGNPLLHYVLAGAQEGREPNSFFDTRWYVARYLESEPQPSDINPLIHFITVGERSGARPSMRFDPEWYVEENPDIDTSGLTPFGHFLQHGHRENRTPIRSENDFVSVADLSATLTTVTSSLIPLKASIELPVETAENHFDIRPQRVSVQAIDRLPISDIGLTVGRASKLPYVAHVKSSYVIGGTRYVIAGDDCILHPEASTHVSGVGLKYGDVSLLENGALRLRFKIRQAAWATSGINIMHEYSNNYFHFIAEVLPRVILASEKDIPFNVPYLLESDLHPTMAKMFDRVHSGEREILRMDRGHLYQVGELFQPSDVTSVADAYSGGQLLMESRLDVARIRRAVDLCRLPISNVRTRRNRKLFVSRVSNYRRLLNQCEIECKLVAEGFEIVRCDSLDLDTQILLFSQAELIVSPTGAQITNIVWCSPLTRVIVLASDHPHHQLYLWSLLGKVSDATVQIIQGPRAYTRDDDYSVHDDYTIDVTEILDTVGSLIKPNN